MAATVKSAPTVEAFVDKQIQLLHQEKNEEYEQNRALRERLSPKLLQKQGVCLLALRVSEKHTGMYGRLVITFEPASHFKKELPSHRISTGDIVGVYPSQKTWTAQCLMSGIMTKCTPGSVSIAVDASAEMDSGLGDDEQFLLLKLSNDVTYTRLKKALQKLRDYISGSASELIEVMFGLRSPSPPLNLQPGSVQFFNTRLDDSQKEAVLFALSQREIAIIHGPPGTGKSTTVVEIVVQAVRRGLKVLACAPSNIAVDGLVERLAGSKLRVVRLGHPARALPAVQRHSLDAVLSATDATRIVEDVRREVDVTLSKMRETHGDKGERHRLQGLVRSLRKELRERSDKAVKEILSGAQVVLATLTSATDSGPLKILDEEHFDLVVVDECSQATEAACWVALLKCGKCVLAGDHKQLPPTIISKQAAQDGLAVTLMERLLEAHGADQGTSAIVRMLTVQYRMHELIMKWASDALYGGRLTAHPSVSHHLLRDLPGVQDDENTCLPLLLIDTTGCDLYEVDLPEEVSKANEGEADLVVIHVENLIKAGVKCEDIAVIAPYNLQVEVLRSRFSAKYPNLEVKSVDGFQGREKEAVVISFVRSNTEGDVGFLAEDRRLNVAVTRARRHVALVCDAHTISHHGFLARLIEYFEQHGEVRNAHLYMEEGYSVGEESTEPVLQLRKDLDEAAYMAPASQSTVSVDAQPVVRAAGTVAQLSKSTKLKSSVAAACIKQQQQEQRPSVLATAIGKSLTPDGLSDEGLVDSNGRRRALLESAVADFARDGQRTEHAMSSTLNSYERRVVHEVAEIFGLGHLSTGEGSARHIVLTKASSAGSQRTPVCTALLPATAVSSAQLLSKTQAATDVATRLQPQSQHKDVVRQATVVGTAQVAMADKAPHGNSSTDGNSIKCAFCHGLVPRSNLDLHELACKAKRLQPLGADTAAEHSVLFAAAGAADANTKSKSSREHGGSASSKPAPAKSKGQKSNGPGRAAVQASMPDDFDDIIREANRINSTCGFGPQCKASVLTLGQDCRFCARRFCLSHHMPEVHGCGAAIKAYSRSVVSREGVVYSGSGVPNKKPNAARRSELERKLARKLGTLGEQRKPKGATPES